MSMVVVDPELFVTCRLCLEDKGTYQIVPNIIQQIKYCFDINVDPFDGLPQLLCTKCEKILSENYNTKKTFIEKQNYLINRLHGKDESSLTPQQKEVTNNKQTDYDKNEKEINICKNIKRKAINSSTSSDADSNKDQIFPKTKDILNKTEKFVNSWRNGYKKQFLCRMCKACRTKKSAILRHVRIHKHLKAKYRNAFNKYCTVALNKIDNTPNITGADNAVVYSQNKIIQGGNLNYFVVYTKQTENISGNISFSDNHETHNSLSERRISKKDYERSDSSDDNVIVKPKRRRYLLSRSSNETVIIATDKIYDSSDSEEDSKAICKAKDSIDLNISDCINIEDSSDGSSNENHIDLRSTNKKQNVKVDYKTINNIVSMCRKNYLKKTYCDNGNVKNKHISSTESQVKHKILSMGMKIINKQGCNCTGLLRFMEHKNLDIDWMLNVTKDLNYPRIMTKLRPNGERKKENLGWQTISSSKLSEVPKQRPNFREETTGSLSSSAIVNRQTDENDIPPEDDSAVLYSICNNETRNKLLNANPVANPKQLPKKLVGNETKTVSITKITTDQNLSKADEDDRSVHNTKENSDDKLCMPIITSTTSLAVLSKDKKDNESVNNDAKIDKKKCLASQNVSNMSTPRIKVKPASELMCERVLNFNSLLTTTTPVSSILHQNIQTGLQYGNTINLYIPNITVIPFQEMSQPTDTIEMPNLTSVSCINIATKSAVNKCDYVTLDTAELPNTKTNSPFRYFKNLLQIHNITLLDANEILSRDFICLIKFKVLYKQESKDQPVIVCLSLFCLGNTFCLKIKDRNQENINIEKISANWQWEILKICKGDVVNKLLQNARRLSPEVYEYTNNFLCLLKSIDFKNNM